MSDNEKIIKLYRYPSLPPKFFQQSTFAVSTTVQQIIHDVRQNGDKALMRYTRLFDRVKLTGLRVGENEFQRAGQSLPPKLSTALHKARQALRRFARAQLNGYRDFSLLIAPGVHAGQRVIPIERIGIYVPSGRYPLISTLLMCAVPAQVAGVKEIAVCSPPTTRGSVAPPILAAAVMLGIREVYRIGGAQAIAALAFGTQTIRAVDKIFGPGNIFVNQAKKAVYGIAGIDFIAGPTEIMVIADRSADARIIAADLLAQAEHDIQAEAVLVTTDRELAGRVIREIQIQLQNLATAKTARRALADKGAIILVQNLKQAAFIANRKAPEHLELQVRQPSLLSKTLVNYGSLFIGSWSAEVLADYASGLNHTLPTAGAARYTGGLSVRDFLKVATTLDVSRLGLNALGLTAETLARAEGLDGHFRAIRYRRRQPD